MWSSSAMALFNWSPVWRLAMLFRLLATFCLEVPGIVGTSAPVEAAAKEFGRMFWDS